MNSGGGSFTSFGNPARSTFRSETTTRTRREARQSCRSDTDLSSRLSLQDDSVDLDRTPTIHLDCRSHERVLTGPGQTSRLRKRLHLDELSSDDVNHAFDAADSHRMAVGGHFPRRPVAATDLAHARSIDVE